MQRTLIGAVATGALAVLATAAVATAAGPTTVSATVSGGTTILAPGAVNIGSGYPGQTISNSGSVSWWSNEAGKQIAAQLDGDLSDGALPTAHSISAADVKLTSPAHLTPSGLNNVSPVATIPSVSTTLEAPSSSGFTLTLLIPSAAEGTYTNTLTWSVIP